MQRDQTKWVARLASKPLAEWTYGKQYVAHRGYTLREVWACPVVGGRVFEVRLTCGYPDARTVELILCQKGRSEPVRLGWAERLYSGLERACDWLDAVEANVELHPRHTL